MRWSLAQPPTQDSCWSEVTLAIARWHSAMGDRYDRLAGEAWKWRRRPPGISVTSAIARFPVRSVRSTRRTWERDCKSGNWMYNARKPTLPDAPFKVALRYTNARKVWLRIVKDPVEINQRRDGERDHGAWLTTQKPVRNGRSNCPMTTT
jgi:hypothetical protein